MKVNRRRLAPFVYGFGILAILAAGIRYLLVPQFDTWVQVMLAVGVVSLAAGVLLDPERVRRALSGRQARYGSNALLISLAFTGIVVVVNVLAYNNPKRLDMTEDKEYSLSPETLLLLSEIGEPVMVKGFYTSFQSSSQDQLRILLEEYELRSGGLVDFEFIDPEANPLEADKYGVTRSPSAVVIIGDAFHVVDFPSESEITSAIVRLANPEERKVYFLTGHGERSLEATDEGGLSQLKSALEGKNYQVDNLSLIVQGAIPEDALVVVIAGPTVPIPSDEVALLSEYVAGGNALVAMVEPTVEMRDSGAEDPLVDYLRESWGVDLVDDLVIDLNSLVPFAGISDRYASGHPITTRMQNLATIYQSVRSADLLPLENPSVTRTELVLTGENSWGETDIEALTQGTSLQYDEGSEDRIGPLTLAVAVEDAASGARLVVIGDSDFASNADYPTSGNGDMIVNSIDWASKQEQLIDITPKQQTQRLLLPPSRQTIILILLGTVVALPGSIVVSGVIVGLRRRRMV